MANDIFEVFSSYDNIRLQIIQHLLDELGLSETDLHRGTFVAYLIDILSHLSANVMFYSGMAYRESFMTLAQLPESVYNLAAFLGYKPKKAVPPQCDVLIQIPLDFTEPVILTFPKDHAFSAGDIIYRLRYKVEVAIDPTIPSYKVTVVDTDKGQIYPLPYTITDNLLSFTVTTIQQEERVYEFISDPTLQPYVFSRYDIEFEEQLADIEVYVDDVLWTEFESMYLMRPFDTGYVVRLTKDGAAIFFGNGIFGQQPPKSVPIVIKAYLTLGEEGKIASGMIKKGDRIYYDTSAGRKILNYLVTNPSSSVGGTNIEHIDEVRRNALVHIQALNRLVSSYDYSNFQIITGLPFRDSLSILKRSDLKCNEVDLFTTIELFNDIVPTRTIKVSGHIDDLHLQPLDVVTYDGREYRVLFEYTPDDITKEVKTFYYAQNIVFQPDVLEANLETVDIVITQGAINVDLVTKNVTVDLLYESSSPGTFTGTVRIRKDTFDRQYTLTDDGTKLTVTIPVSELPVSKLNFEFRVYQGTTLVLRLATIQIVRQSMEEITFAHFNWIDEVARTIEYMIPVVDKEWYDNLTDAEKSMFHTEILNKFAQGATTVYRMLNTSINVLFANTIGRLSTLHHNEENYQIQRIDLLEPPATVSIGEHYVVAGLGGTITDATNPWYGHEKEIAIVTNDSPVTWEFIQPALSTIVLDKSTGLKYIWNGEFWIQIDSLMLPLTIEADVYLDVTDTTSSKIVDDIKTILQDYFQGHFGIMRPLFRSEIVRIIQSVPGVVYVKLKKPEFDIFFNFKISKLSQEDLFQFSTDFVYFKDIVINPHVYDAEVTE